MLLKTRCELAKGEHPLLQLASFDGLYLHVACLHAQVVAACVQQVQEKLAAKAKLEAQMEEARKLKAKNVVGKWKEEKEAREQAERAAQEAKVSTKMPGLLQA